MLPIAPVQTYLDQPLLNSSKKEELSLKQLQKIASIFDTPPQTGSFIFFNRSSYTQKLGTPRGCAEKQLLNAIEQCKGLRDLMSNKKYPLSKCLADEKNNTDLCKMLSGLKISKKKHSQKMTPLHMAIDSGSKEFVANILQLNTKEVSSVSLTSRCKDPKTKMMLSPISLAVARGEIKCFDLLVRHFEDIRENTAAIFKENIENIGNLLHLAIVLEKTEMLEHLLTKHIEKTKRLINNNQQHPFLFTPIHLAVSNGNLEALFLLHSEGANLECTNYEGQTPLHHAVMQGNKQVVDVLLFLGAKTTTRDLQGNDAKYYLSKKTFLDVDIEASLSNAYLKEKALKQATPNFYDYPPKNLVLQVEGAKGLIQIGGGLGVLENRGILSNIKRVAGTSAGAIIATFLALGHSVDEIQKLLMSTELTQFLDFMKKNGSKNGDTAIFRSLDSVNLPNNSGLLQGKVFRRWIAKRIEKTTDIEYFTFGDLRKLVQSGKGDYKHLHVFATPQKNIVQFNSEEEKWDKYIIADTVRFSMGIPAVFDAQLAYYRDDHGHRHSEKNKFYIDGGVIYNLPVEAFDRTDYIGTKFLSEKEKKRPVFNKETLALSLCNPDDESAGIKSSKPPEPSKFDALYDAIETRMRGKHTPQERALYNKHRIIKISSMGVEMPEFTFSKEQMEELIDSGKEDIEDFLENQRQFGDRAALKLPDEKDPQLLTLISRYKHRLPINKRDKNGYTALQRSVLQKDAMSIKDLLNRPYIDPNIVNDKDNKMSALLYAVSNQKTRIVSLLLDNASVNVNVQDVNGQSALHWAIAYQYDKKLVDTLLQHPGININLQDQNGLTPLHLSLHCYSKEILMTLLTDPRIDENILNNTGLTPLQEILKMTEDTSPQLTRYVFSANKLRSTTEKAALLILKKFCRLLNLDPQEYFKVIKWDRVVFEDLLEVLTDIESDPESKHENRLKKTMNWIFPFIE